MAQTAFIIRYVWIHTLTIHFIRNSYLLLPLTGHIIRNTYLVLTLTGHFIMNHYLVLSLAELHLPYKSIINTDQA